MSRDAVLPKTILPTVSQTASQAPSSSPHFTYEYAQPENYHFCQDSVLFARFLANQIEVSEFGPDFRVLDVCAGCGVVGFELAHHISEIQNLDFLEIQNEFGDYFVQNLEMTGHDPERFRWVNRPYSSLLKEDVHSKYHLIVGNPPYFEPQEGALSPDHMNNRCRFFIDESFDMLVKAVTAALHPAGRAYLLVKPGSQHGRSQILQAQLAAGPDCAVERVADIRGTDVLRFRHRA